VRRLLIVGAVVVAAATSVAVLAALSRSRDGASRTVAAVAGHRITRKTLDLTVDHFHEVADREGRPFPTDGTPELTVVRRQALAVLLADLKTEVAAEKLGVHVSDADVERRVASGRANGEDEGAVVRIAAEAAFVRRTARAQIVQERAFHRLTAGIRISRAAALAYYRAHPALYRPQTFAEVHAAITSQLLAARKNAVFQRWLRQALAMPAEIRDASLKG
jgi:hypothetical protein